MTRIKDKKYEETSLYKHGLALKKLGEALMSDKSTIVDIADLAFDAGLVIGYQLLPLDGDSAK